MKISPLNLLFVPAICYGLMLILSDLLTIQGSNFSPFIGIVSSIISLGILIIILYSTLLRAGNHNYRWWDQIFLVLALNLLANCIFSIYYLLVSRVFFSTYHSQVGQEITTQNLANLGEGSQSYQLVSFLLTPVGGILSNFVVTTILTIIISLFLTQLTTPISTKK